ncbi:hypothetical protein BDV10DRAFT_189563 [Aspergillus recurvatus]
MRRNGTGTTIFYPLEVPSSGSDTLYLSTIAAYEHLSEDFRSRIEGLHATHSGFSQAAVHDHRERYIREPIETVHPVVRTHPVTKKKSLYVNRLYTRKIVGWKEEESRMFFYLPIPRFLYRYKGFRINGEPGRYHPQLPLRPHREGSRLAYSHPLDAWNGGGYWRLC